MNPALFLNKSQVAAHIGEVYRDLNPVGNANSRPSTNERRFRNISSRGGSSSLAMSSHTGEVAVTENTIVPQNGTSDAPSGGTAAVALRESILNELISGNGQIGTNSANLAALRRLELSRKVLANRIDTVPFSLCLVCLRKLQYVSQTDLLDRMSQLPSKLMNYFPDEAVFLLGRATECGCPTHSRSPKCDE